MTLGVLLAHVAARWAVTRTPTCGWVPDESETDMSEHEIDGSTSDGYHTFDELYDYRMLYNAHAARGWAAAGIPVVKSWRHSDGQECFGGDWFIVTAQLPTGQVSNHYPFEDWDLFDVPEVETAPEWDRHTPTDAVNRLRDALLRRGHGMTERNYTRADMARAWREGAESEWHTNRHGETGDGYPGDPSPYEQEEA